MISVIICSINPTFAQQVQENIAATIGVAWEPIVINNTIAPKSITAVYNQGAAMAQYDIVCFVHEDVLFQTNNWGQVLVDAFKKDAGLGLIGVAGSKYKSKTPSGWYTGFKELDCCNIAHLNRTGQKEILSFNPEAGSLSQQVVVIDGVFMCCPKRVWEVIRFDEVLLTDFHLYDLDFSLRVAEKYKVLVSFEIEMLHITKGNHYGNQWLEATLKWHQPMEQKLPAFLPGYDLKSREYENSIVKTWLIRLKHEHIHLRNKLHWLWSIKIWAHVAAWPYVVLFLLKSIFKKK